jgi:hypothetical protein
VSRPLSHQVLGIAAALWATGCTEGTPASPTSGESRVPTAPASAALHPLSTPVRRLRRLSNREYNSVVRDLLGDSSQPANRFVVDVYQNGYDNGSAGLAVQSYQVVDYEGSAEAVAANAVTGQMTQLLGGCDPTAQGQPACVEAFLASFAPRAYRRPLTDSERQRLRDVFQADALTGGFGRGVETMLEVVLQSPQFLYREELGPLDGTASTGAEVRLTDYEVASELSFLLSGSIPDAQLWAAVQGGRFRTAQDYQREATRLLNVPGARDALRAFLHEWFATDRLATVSKDAAFYPTFNSAVAASMRTELDQYFDYVLWTGTGSLRELFTSPQSFVDPTLGQVYGLPVFGAGFQSVKIEARRGILARPGYLAVHSATDSSGPIARGVFLLQSIMCSPLAPPPPNVPPAPAANAPSVKNLTTRQRFERHVSNAFCAGCHTRIDGAGFGFEEFDGIGAYRTMENGQAVDSSGTIVGTGEIDGAYRGVTELTTRLSGSHLLADCYVRQAYRYAMGQVEDTGDDLKLLTGAFSADAKMTDVLLAIVQNPLFLMRSFERPSP